MPKKQGKYDHWLVIDRPSDLRDVNVRWEKYMEQIGIHQARRIYLSMPGSVSLSISGL